MQLKTHRTRTVNTLLFHVELIGKPMHAQVNKFDLHADSCDSTIINAVASFQHDMDLMH